MPSKLCRVLLASFLFGVGCAGENGSDKGGSGGSSAGSGGSGGSRAGTGGSSSSGGSGGSTSTGGTGGSSAGGTGGSATGGSGGNTTGGSGGSGGAGGSGGTGASGTGGSSAGSGGTGGSSTGSDAKPTSDSGTASDTSSAPVPDGGGAINVEGPIPIWDGPPVGPEVKMDCPDDPLAGFVEYKDTFRVEHPYDLMVKDRFSIDGGIYTFFVKQGDKRHNPTSTASNPRTEARWSQNFRTGIRMFSGDIYWEKSVTNGTVVMQVHTTTTGIGPVYMVANGNSVSPIPANKVPGGIIDRWINLKVEINAATTGSRYWVNNCLVATKGSGTRGDGNNYFKLGVYHCDSGTCRARAKNIKLYMKP